MTERDFIPIKLRRRTKKEREEYFASIWDTLPEWQRDAIKHFERSTKMSTMLKRSGKLIKEPTNKHSMAHKRWCREQEGSTVSEVMEGTEEERDAYFAGQNDIPRDESDPPSEDPEGDVGFIKKIGKIFSSDR